MFFYDHRAKWEQKAKGYPSGAIRSVMETLEKRMSMPLKERAQTDLSFMERVIFPDEVLHALVEANHGRCAFCEGRKKEMSIYRFRPYGNVHPVKAPSDVDCYQWLAFDWLNLFPICSDCLPHDPNYFPVYSDRARHSATLTFEKDRLTLKDEDQIQPGGTFSDTFGSSYSQRRVAGKVEMAGLIMPGDRADPRKLIEVDLGGLWLSKRSKGKGANTISHFNLNAENTQRSRREVIRDLVSILEAGNLNAFYAINFERDEYGSSKYLFLRQIAEGFQRRSPTTRRRPLTVSRIKGTVSGYLLNPQDNEGLKAFLEDIREDPTLYTETLKPVRKPSEEKVGKLPTVLVNKRLEGEALRLQSVKIVNFRSLKEIKFELQDRLAAGARERLNTDLEQRSETGLADVDMEDRKLQEYAPCLLILGENAAGKSTLLEAIALAAMEEEVREALGEKPTSYLLDAEFLGASARPDGSSRVSSASVELTFIANPAGEFTDTNRSEDREVAMTLDLTPDGFAMDGKVPEGFRLPPVFAYGAQRLSGSAPRMDAVRHVDTLFSADKQLSNPEKWLASLDETTRNGVVQAIRGLIQIDGRFEAIVPVETKGSGPPERCNISLKKMRPFVKTDTEAGTGATRGSAVRGPKEREYTVAHRMDAVSSGYRAIIAMICDVLSGIMEATGTNAIEARHEPAIVLIDEIEAHLHPRWKINLTRGLRHALPNVTFIMTSHDPLCIRGMFDGEVTVMERVSLDAAEGEIQEEVQRLKDFPSPETMTVEQLLVADFFQLATTDDTIAMDQVINYWELLEREELGRLSKQELDKRGIDEPKALTQSERAKLERFKGEIDEELPYGRTAQKQIIYEAVARVLEERRRGHRERIEVASANVRDQVRNFLESIMP